MKKLLLICAFAFLYYKNPAQNRRSPNHNYNNSSSIKTGLGLTIGGVALTVGGFLTPITYTEIKSNNGSNYYNTQRQQLPPLQQIRTYPIVCGITITLAGLITLAANKN